MKVLDLFSGIGGFSLGLERAGFETVAFCEIEKYPQKILKKHWPDVPIYNDVRELTYERLKSDGIARIDVICGGFPCQDISAAGNQAGIGEETRSGLWSECARLLGDIRPKYAIFENVTALLNGSGGDWFKRVLWDIQSVGYDAEWHCIPASELGAHHHRDRIWIVAYPRHRGGRDDKRGKSDTSQQENRKGLRQFDTNKTLRSGEALSTKAKISTNTSKIRCRHGRDNRQKRHVQNDEKRQYQKIQRQGDKREFRAGATCSVFPDTDSKRGCSRDTKRQNAKNVRQPPIGARINFRRVENWNTEPRLGRVANGLFSELDILGEINESSNMVTKAEGKSAEPEGDFIRWKILRAMWENRKTPEASPELYEQRMRDFVPEMSYENPHGRWHLGQWIEKNKGLRDLWQTFYSKPQHEAQELQQELLERIRKIKRTKEVGPAKDRSHRLKC